MRLFLIIATFFFLFFLSFYENSYSESKKCNPKESNDCLVHDAITVRDGLVSLTWEGLSLESKSLPKNSWYKIIKNNADEFQVIFYPDVGSHYILGHHDFEIWVSIRRVSDNKSKPLSCLKNLEVKKDLGDQKFSAGSFEITIQHRLNYFYLSNGKGPSNPNPYTPEVLEILKKVVKNLSFGKCEA